MRNYICVIFSLAACAAAVEAQPVLDAAAIAPYRRKPDDPAIAGGSSSVRWREWNGAFAEAAKGGKPVFVFVTANWCHWGKVMERVTFRDAECATRLNEEFIPVRLNRDERPDLDLRLQQAVQALTGRRGWPLCVCLTPEGRIFGGGTYFPPDDDPAANRPGMRALIHQVIGAWRNEREAMQAQGRELDEALRKAAAADTTGALPADMLDRAAQAARAALEGGKGFAGEGRFPAPRVLELLLAHHARSGDAKSLDAATRTLDAMLHGGIYDQIGGGFHRCCADRWWRLPRFEKLIAPNAEMLALCLRAWQATGTERYKRAVEETLACWTALSDPSGAYFFGSQAGGTSDLDDGDTFTWTVKDFEIILRNDADCRLARAFYDVQETGDLPATAPHRNVLFQALSLEEAARAANIPQAEAAARLENFRRQLKSARDLRPAPSLDRNIYVDGNALMAAAFIESGAALGQPAYTERGVKTLRALLKYAVTDAGALHVVPTANDLNTEAQRTQRTQRNEENSKLETRNLKLLQDDAALVYACVIAFEATREKEFSDAAEAGLRRLYENFWDKENGGYFDRALTQHSALSTQHSVCDWRVKLYQDTDQASPNSLVAVASARLAALTGRKDLSDGVNAIAAAFGGVLEELGPYGAGLIIAVDVARYGPVKLKK